MKAKTQIEQAVKLCYDAYVTYCRKVDGIPVIPTFPKVEWMRGSLKNPNTGWMIDGRLYPGTAEQVVTYWTKQADRWNKRMRSKLREEWQLPASSEDAEVPAEH